MYVRMYTRTKESLALNREIGTTNWQSTVIADIRDIALSFVVSQMADPTQFWSAIFMFCSENGRWQAAISSSAYVHTYVCMYVHMYACKYSTYGWMEVLYYSSEVRTY